MLLGVRYPSGFSGGIDDAEVYEFRSGRWYEEARTPLVGPVERLVQLGAAMIVVCDSPADDMKANLDRLDAACDALEKQLDVQDAAAKPKSAAVVP